MNSSLSLLHPYPFEKLNVLFKDVTPADLPLIPLSIGEPKHPAPEFVKQAIIDNFNHLSTYPNSKGLPELRESIARWLTQRFQLNHISSEDHILPVTGTREGIFSFVQALINRDEAPYVVMPNPFYQIYEGATLLAGAKPYFINCTAENDYLGDFDAVPSEVWEKTALLFVCTPGNPTGAVLSKEKLKKLIQLSDQYNFVIASDECYSELWFDQAPVGLLEVCAEIGRDNYKNCIVFHSLSKRSNLPGMRSGFVAGDAELLKPYLKFRTYHGAAMPVQHQLASIAAWNDEAHVEENRQQYRAKFNLFQSELGQLIPLKKPDAGFYYWLHVDNDEAFAKMLMEKAHIKVLPGRYLSRETEQGNPGENHVRMALVADLAQCEQVVQRLKKVL
ncbi:succinyldiaminopimelate transaminase [Acinetobacter baylyi]|uniref:Putative aminotransferase n=1 Tax=Acinetobacter baylyi (strain ATCC 33305 / BD413 / ADP1) TaxID=62977 RepID=Q6FAM4_ACIAD|nr:succinyldiaminopimelate transaminase [Acinetobacter baylyi]ENV53825.1 succinyldiaminopimelate transaminase [Acinetobacter baylyi DSM 14961 = CIP 107474]KAF2373202.1 succinyldiaminopimelate transaminase [Acinetobacter baylyi]KAF2374381.1 succinyldiaminopimelate transaminase [Acinetobacter baylyi]KAF2376185.1 succinyldiaminopimelate transaminase [Acinetobacter baylyi]KAF2381036.1 succinyldiaminopimelate transaminase [Acinetobacter baylyi]